MTALGVGEGGLRLHDVYLEGAVDEATAVVGQLSVIVDSAGITVLGPTPGAVRVVGWERLSSVELGGSATLPGGKAGSSLELVVDGRPLRLLVPTASAPGAPPSTSRPQPPATAPPAQPAVSPAVSPAVPLDDVPAEVRTIEDGAEAPQLEATPAPASVEPVAPPVAEVPADAAVVPAAPAPPPSPAWASGAHDAPPVPSLAVPDEPGAVPHSDVVPPAVAELQPARLVRPRPALRAPLSKTQHLIRVTIVALLVALVLVAGTIWLVRPGSGGTPARAPESDAAIAARVGLQRSELPGWQSRPAPPADVFAAGATTRGAAAARTAARSSAVLARCLHVPVSALDGAFDMGGAAAQRSARAASRRFADPAGDAGAISSLVDVVRTDKDGRADAAVFGDPSLFATCYQPYVQAMLPFAPGAPPQGFATATVQPTVVPVLSGTSDVEIAAFQIARIGNDHGQSVTTVTTAVAVFGGRVLATVDATSDLVFPLDTLDSALQHVEARVLGVSLF